MEGWLEVKTDPLTSLFHVYFQLIFFPQQFDKRLLSLLGYFLTGRVKLYAVIL